MTRIGRAVMLPLALAVALMASGCGVPGVGPSSHSGSMHLVIDSPTQDQVITVRSVSVQAHVDYSPFQLRYLLDGNDLGAGADTFLIPNISPGNHRLEVEALHGDGSPFTPVFHAGVNFIIQ